MSLQPTHLANFNQVQSIQYSALEEKDRKGMLQLNVAGAPEVKTHTHSLFCSEVALCETLHWLNLILSLVQDIQLYLDLITKGKELYTIDSNLS